ncbi:MAG: transposase [Phycisphaerales bacterium]|jgi:REP element-mobilizing transposase RayT
MPALAFFLTWHSYGTWLHGDARGTMDDVHNRAGTPRLPPDRKRLEHAEFLMAQPAFILSPEMRTTVDSAIRLHAEKREWRVLALNVRSNHVHVCVAKTGHYTPELVMQQFKAWATRGLIAAGHATRDRKAWTRHGSTRYINDEESLGVAIDYVKNRQD